MLFYHHDLGGFVRNRRDLSMTLVMGYGLSWWTHSATPPDAERDWLGRLCRLQAAIGPRCAGRALDDFQYLAPEVIRSRWGDLEIVANLSAQPWPVASGAAIAPEGFRAKALDLEAGIFQGPAAAGGAAVPQWIIRAGGLADWSAGPESQTRQRGLFTRRICHRGHRGHGDSGRQRHGILCTTNGTGFRTLANSGVGLDAEGVAAISPGLRRHPGFRSSSRPPTPKGSQHHAAASPPGSVGFIVASQPVVAVLTTG